LRGEGQLGLRAHDRTLPPRLELKTGPLARHEERRQAKESALETRLQGAQRPIAHGKSPHHELVPERRVTQDDGPIARDRRHLGEEQPRVPAAAPERGDRVGLGGGEGLVARVGVRLDASHAADSGERPFGRRWQGCPQGPVGELQDGGEPDQPGRRGGESQAIDVDQAVGESDLPEEAIDVRIASRGREIDDDVRLRGRALDGRARQGLDGAQPGAFRKLANESDVRARVGAVRQDPAQGLEAPVEEGALLREGARRGRGEHEEG
jgi:hypothetical protein